MSDLFSFRGAVICTGLSFAASVISYIKYQQAKEILKSIEIPHFKPDYNLRMEVQKYKRLYAAVEGKVHSVVYPLKTNSVPECYGVIHKVATREQQVFTVPFCLVPQNGDIRTVHVHVESPLTAEGDYLQEVHTGAEQKVAHGYRTADGQNVQEKMLCLNSVVTGVGDVVMSQRCEGMVLEPPVDGRKFFLFYGGYDSIKKRHEQKCSLLRMMASITGVMTGCSILSMLIYSRLNTGRKRN